MPKIILEKSDIEKLIKEKYQYNTIEGLNEDTQIILTVSDFQPPPQSPQPPNQVRLDNGSIDADKSGLSLKNREKTIPGHAMGRERGRLPVF